MLCFAGILFTQGIPNGSLSLLKQYISCLDAQFKRTHYIFNNVCKLNKNIQLLVHTKICVYK
jgi:hypothetical protein